MKGIIRIEVKNKGGISMKSWKKRWKKSVAYVMAFTLALSNAPNYGGVVQ